MRKISALMFVMLLCSSALSYAHPPSSIDLSYDPATEAVDVVVHHDVKNPSTHFIKEIVVSVNEKPVLTDQYTRQSNDKDQPAVYELRDLKPGDRVSVKASCSISGDGTADIVIK